MVVDEGLVEIVVEVVVDELPRGFRLELLPGVSLVPPEQLHGLAVQPQLVFVDVAIQVLAPHHLRDLAQLVVVVLASEEGHAVEHDAHQHARQRPDVQRVVVLLQKRPRTGLPCRS